MKIVVLGATGGTGREVVEQALEAGHEVVAVVRNPSGVTMQHDRLRIVRGDVTDANSLATHLEGADALISALGSRTSREPVTLYSRSAEAMLEALRRRNIRRLLVVTAGGYVKDPRMRWWWRWAMQPILMRVLRHPYDDMQRMERLVEQSDLSWTVVRPARLTDGPRTGNYRTDTEGLVPDGWTISRADTAHMLLDALAQERFVRQLVSVAY